MAKTVFVRGTRVLKEWLNAVFSHVHDGQDLDGHCGKINLTDATDVTGQLPFANVTGYGSAATHANTDFAASGDLANHESASGTAVHGLGSAATHSNTDFAASGELETHENSNGTAVHGLGSASTHAASDFAAASSSGTFNYTFLNTDFTTELTRTASWQKDANGFVDIAFPDTTGLSNGSTMFSSAAAIPEAIRPSNALGSASFPCWIYAGDEELGKLVLQSNGYIKVLRGLVGKYTANRLASDEYTLANGQAKGFAAIVVRYKV